MDDVPVEEVKRFEQELIDSLRTKGDGALSKIADTGVLDDDTAAALSQEIEGFKRNLWRASEVAAS